MAGRQDNSTKEKAPWSIWTDQASEQGKSTTCKVGCSICGRDMKQAVVFPDHKLNICFGCLEKMVAAADAAQKEANRKMMEG